MMDELSKVFASDLGLSLVVNAGVYDYVPGITEESGARVVIHNQTDMPFPSQHSFAANIGASNYLAIKKVSLRTNNPISISVTKNINSKKSVAKYTLLR